MAETGSSPNTICIDIDEFELSGKPQVEQPKIPKVPKLFRGMKSHEECYDPLVVSIGPYHHGKEELQEMEALKYAMALKFFEGCTVNKYKMVEELASKARNFYSDDATKTLCDKQFGQMMFLDGCFILQFLSSLSSQGNDQKKPKAESVEMKPHVECLVIRDLLLLENQVPYIVLKQLMESKPGYKEEEIMIEFMESGRRFKIPKGGQDSSKDNKNNPLHLLQLFHTQFTGDLSHKENKCGSCCQSSAMFTTSSCTESFVCTSADEKDRYRSAKELRNVGIHFRPSKTTLFTGFSYKPYFLFGILKLPPIVIDDLSKALLLNLVAYETSPTTLSNTLPISSYICFLDTLIDEPEDVKELRSTGILINALGSDQELAELFNQISKHLVFRQDAFADIRCQINQRYKNRITRWMTEWINTHFSSPWTVLAFLGAVSGLVLTAIQTYVSVWPINNK